MAIPFLAIAMEIARHAIPELVKKIAGDKSGEVAKQVIETARVVTGTSTPEEALAKLKQDAELTHKYRLALLEHERIRDEMADKDRADARARDVALRQAGQENKRADMMVLFAALGLVVCVVAAVGVLWMQSQSDIELTESAFTAVMVQLGNFAAYFGLSLRDAFQFEFGSSRGSRNKDAHAFSALGGEGDRDGA